MRDSRNEPSKAKKLAGLLTGNAKNSTITVTIQRSHRFPVYEFTLIENMAKLADCSVSAMINQVISVGIDSLYEHLPKETIEQIHSLTQEQIDRADKIFQSEEQESGKRKK